VRHWKEQEKEIFSRIRCSEAVSKLQHHHRKMNTAMISGAAKQFHNIHSLRLSLFRLSKPKSPIMLSTNNNISSPISIRFNSPFPCNLLYYSLSLHLLFFLFKYNNPFHSTTYCSASSLRCSVSVDRNSNIPSLNCASLDSSDSLPPDPSQSQTSAPTQVFLLFLQPFQ